MAQDGPTYPVGVISYAPDYQAYTVDAAMYEKLLRQNGVNAGDAERFRRLLAQAQPYVKSKDSSLSLYDTIEVALNGRPATV